jgi:uncharacterized YigZ family protein
METDEFLTITKPGTGTYKEKGSKFYGFAEPVSNEEEIKEKLDHYKAVYHDARHHCYAYRTGISGDNFRMNDDGEPSSTAGKPIYGQILSHNLTNILIVVVRYFGGTKLGTSGLIRAYKAAAEEAVSTSKIVKKTVNELYQIDFDYPLMNDIMKVLHDEEIEPLAKNFQASCSFKLGIRKNQEERIVSRFNKINGLIIKKLNKQMNS